MIQCYGGIPIPIIVEKCIQKILILTGDTWEFGNCQVQI